MSIAKDRKGLTGGIKINEPLPNQAKPYNASKPFTFSLVKDKGKVVLVEDEPLANELNLMALFLMVSL